MKSLLSTRSTRGNSTRSSASTLVRLILMDCSWDFHPVPASVARPSPSPASNSRRCCCSSCSRCSGSNSGCSKYASIRVARIAPNSRIRHVTRRFWFCHQMVLILSQDVVRSVNRWRTSYQVVFVLSLISIRHVTAYALSQDSARFFSPDCYILAIINSIHQVFKRHTSCLEISRHIRHIFKRQKRHAIRTEVTPVHLPSADSDTYGIRHTNAPCDVPLCEHIWQVCAAAAIVIGDVINC